MGTLLTRSLAAAALLLTPVIAQALTLPDTVTAEAGFITICGKENKGCIDLQRASLAMFTQELKAAPAHSALIEAAVIERTRPEGVDWSPAWSVYELKRRAIDRSYVLRPVVIADPAINSFVIPGIETEPGRVRSMLGQRCGDDRACLDLNMTGFDRLRMAYDGADTTAREKIAATVRAEVKDGQPDWYWASALYFSKDDQKEAQALSARHRTPPFRSYCSVRVSKSGRHASSWCSAY